MGFPDFQPTRVSEEQVCIYLFRQNPVFTSVHLRSPVHVVPPLSAILLASKLITSQAVEEGIIASLEGLQLGQYAVHAHCIYFFKNSVRCEEFDDPPV